MVDSVTEKTNAYLTNVTWNKGLIRFLLLVVYSETLEISVISEVLMTGATLKEKLGGLTIKFTYPRKP